MELFLKSLSHHLYWLWRNVEEPRIPLSCHLHINRIKLFVPLVFPFYCLYVFPFLNQCRYKKPPAPKRPARKMVSYEDMDSTSSNSVPEKAPTGSTIDIFSLTSPPSSLPPAPPLSPLSPSPLLPPPPPSHPPLLQPVHIH